MIEIPGQLVQLIARGEVVLVLGAGASFGAQGSEGERAPSGKELATLLSDEFLSGKYKDRSLSEIADLAISESDLGTVQIFIADLLRPLQPATFHELIPTFRWHGLVTTNYDLVVEKAYNTTASPVQKCSTFVSNSERVEDILRSPDHVLLIKLHGCITRINDTKLPLILTPDQYISHRKNRDYLFTTVSQWGKEKTLLFIGQELQDNDLRQLISIIEERVGDFRPRYFMVRPGMQEEEKTLWARRKIDVIDSSFEDFLLALDAKIPRDKRRLLSLLRSDHPITRHISGNSTISEALRDALASDLEYVHSGVAVQSGKPKDFYRGFDLGWYPIVESLDVRRGIVDKLLLDIILAEESDRASTVEFFVIKAEAGAGKSVLLRRLAWEAATEGGVLAIFCNRVTEWGPIQEILTLTQERMFLFVDEAADHSPALDSLLQAAAREQLPLTIFSAESFSLWEIYCPRLNDHVTEEFELRNLNEQEIEVLVDLLDANASLGARLRRMDRDHRIHEFCNVADRQLLVALHEATQGAPLEAIVEQEFRKLRPRAAQRLYQTVCVLNRLRVPVRAGLISRVHGIPFDRFSEELLAPLDHVVKTRVDPITKDNMYEARHPHIAELVFRRILTRPEARFKEYSEILNELNLAYRTDELAFNGLVKGKSIVDLFPDYEMASQIYDLAEDLAPQHGELFHQRAIYEMRRKNPSTEKAYQALERAWELGRDSASITHTFSELALVQAENSSSPIRKQKYWEKAEDLAKSILRHERSGSYARHTLVKLGIARLKEALGNGQSRHVVEDLISEVESHLERGYQEDPEDSHLIASEADLWSLLEKDKDAIEALEKGFEKNPRDVYVAIRLAKAYEAAKKYDKAIDVVDKGLQADRSNQALNYRKGTLLRKSGERDPELLVWYFRRSFTPSDNKFDAQFWYARYLYELSDADSRRKAKQKFGDLRSAKLPYATKVAVRDRIGGQKPRVFHGTVKRLDSTFGKIQIDGDPDWLFMHETYVDENIWRLLSVGSRVTCQIGFQMRGPVAVDVGVE